jgi:hypothetical protein
LEVSAVASAAAAFMRVTSAILTFLFFLFFSCSIHSPTPTFQDIELNQSATMPKLFAGYLIAVSGDFDEKRRPDAIKRWVEHQGGKFSSKVGWASHTLSVAKITTSGKSKLCRKQNS